jgi:catechol O-methyltransferase
MAFKATPAIIGFGAREGILMLVDTLLHRPSRPQRVLQYLQDRIDPGNPTATLEAMDAFARQKRFLMNVGDVKGKILTQALARSGAGNVLELGTYCGYSAILMALHLKGSGHVDSLEMNPGNAEAARAIIEFAGLSEKITVHTGAAGDIIPSLGRQYDLVFIDHWKNQYLPDLLLIESSEVIKPGSYVVADNIGMFDATGYLDHVRDSGRYDNTNHQAHMEYNDTIFDAVEVSILRH